MLAKSFLPNFSRIEFLRMRKERNFHRVKQSIPSHWRRKQQPSFHFSRAPLRIRQNIPINSIIKIWESSHYPRISASVIRKLSSFHPLSHFHRPIQKYHFFYFRRIFRDFFYTIDIHKYVKYIKKLYVFFLNYK